MQGHARTTILVLGLVALAASGYSTYAHYQILQDPFYAPACDVSATVSCSSVLTSSYGSAFGIPVAVGGVAWSLLVVLLAALGMGSPNRDRAARAAGYTFVLSVVGLAAVFYFGYASFFVIRTLCAACVTFYVAAIGIFLVASRAATVPLTSLPAHLGHDLGAAFKAAVPATAAAAWLVASIGLAVLLRHDDATATPTPAGASPAAAAPTETLDEQVLAEWHAWLDQQPREAEVGPQGEGVKVRLVKFNDYECPSCRVTWAAYKDVIAALEQRYGAAFQYQTLDYPLEPECGFGGAHRSACEGAVAVRLARERERAAEMETWLYENQMNLSRDAIKGALERIAGVSGAEYDKQYASVIPKVREDAQLGNKLGVTGTPTFFLNGIRMPSVRPAHLEAAVAYELQKAGGVS